MRFGHAASINIVSNRATLFTDKLLVGLVILVAVLVHQLDPVYRIFKTIKKCPDWTTISDNDNAARQEIMECLDELSKKDIKLLRKAIERCVAESSVDQSS